MQVTNEQLREFMLDAGLVSRRDYDAAAQEARETETAVGDVLVRDGLVSPDDLRRIYAYALGISFTNLREERIPFDTLSLIPEPIARQHNVIAFRRSGHVLDVALLDLSSLAAIEFVRKKTGLRIIPHITDSESVKDALIQYQKALKYEFGDVIRRESESLQVGVPEQDSARIEDSVSATRIVDALLGHAIVQHASDIHIEPREVDVLVRYRIDGALHDAMMLPGNAGPYIAARIKELSGLDTAKQQIPQDGRFKVESGGEHVAFRVSTFPTNFGEKIVLRLFKGGSSGFALEGLGFWGEGLERLHEALRRNVGMILVAGPSGSGKTTTLYTMLDLVNTPDVSISTIEDPIECQISRINQTPVRADVGVTFAAGLRALMRQDSDMLMIGEICDSETAALAASAACAGRLVFSAVTADCAADAIDRLRDMGVDSALLASTVTGVVGQRLVRKLCESKTAHRLSKSDITRLEKVVDINRVLAALHAEHVIQKSDRIEDITFYRPEPSAECADGFSGYIGVHEVFTMTPALRELVAQQSASDTIAAQARESGMLTIAEDALCKAAQGLTSVEDVLRVATE